MNWIEKAVYDRVKENPKLKLRIRNIYQVIFDILPDKKNYSANPLVVKEGYFFGFHDVDPFSPNEEYVLANRIEIPLRMPRPDDELSVGFWDKSLNNYTTVAQTKAWNYHKGCRLQWLGNSSDSFIFNDIVDSHLGARIYSIKDKSFREIDYPIDTVNKKGSFATSFSYERLNRYMPGYGYVHNDAAFFDESASEKTGLFLIDLNNNTRKMILSLQTLANIDPAESMENANHYVTHTEFSPDGERISFFHRWTHDDPAKRWTRIITCKLDGSDIHVAPTAERVSHYVWDSDHGILAYCQVNGIDGHYIFSDYKMEEPYRVAPSINSDGHQSYVSGTNMFVTGTYPDRRRYAKLFLVDIDTGEKKLLAELKSPKAYQSNDPDVNLRCDLHPRVSRSGGFVCFDSIHTGTRSFCVMQLDK